MSDQFDPIKVRVVAFDLFGTVVDMSGVPREELRAYGEHLRKSRDGEWAPLRFPESWQQLKPYGDVERGLFRLDLINMKTAVLSNCPWELADCIVGEMEEFDVIIQLAAGRVFKPDPRAYQVLCDVLDVPPEDVLMVTANEHFGDIEQARALGMQACLIRGESDIPDVVALSEILGREGVL